MTNNKQQTAVKLYTEEQLLNTADAIRNYLKNYPEKFHESMIEKHLNNLTPIELPSDSLCINCDESKSTHNVCIDCIIKIGRQNIELPSDEEIEDASLEENNDDLSPAEEFQRGVKWMRDKIQGR
jgi:hypothetical protein